MQNRAFLTVEQPPADQFHRDTQTIQQHGVVTYVDEPNGLITIRDATAAELAGDLDLYAEARDVLTTVHPAVFPATPPGPQRSAEVNEMVLAAIVDHKAA